MAQQQFQFQFTDIEKLVETFQNMEVSMPKLGEPELQPDEKKEEEEEQIEDEELPEFQEIALENGFSLLPHQKKAIQVVLHREEQPLHGIRGLILSLEMGLGKTLIGTMVVALTANQATTATLLVCNKSLLYNMHFEIQKFFGNRLRTLLFHRDILREEFLKFNQETARKNHVIVVTYDTLLILARAAGYLAKSKFRGSEMQRRALANVGQIFFQIPWFRIIADESQKFSNPKSLIYQTMMLFPPGRRLCLTGTPIRNYDNDLFAQLRFCGLTKIEKLAHWTIQRYKQFNLNQAIFFMSMEDANLDLPPRKDEKVVLVLTPFETQLYNLFFQTSAQTLMAFKKKEGGVKYANVLEKFTRLRQLCIAPYLITPESKKGKLTNEDKKRKIPGSILGPNYIPMETMMRQPAGVMGIESTKMKGLLEIVQKIPLEDKALIFSNWSSSTHLAQLCLQQHFPADSVLFVDGKTKDRNQVFANFRGTPHIRFLCMTSVGAVGLTLTEANHVILLEPHWNETQNEQASARVWRIGQTKPVTIWELVVKNSIEEKMIEICNQKNNSRDAILAQGISMETLEMLLGIKFDP